MTLNHVARMFLSVMVMIFSSAVPSLAHDTSEPSTFSGPPCSYSNLFDAPVGKILVMYENNTPWKLEIFVDGQRFSREIMYLEPHHYVCRFADAEPKFKTVKVMAYRPFPLLKLALVGEIEFFTTLVPDAKHLILEINSSDFSKITVWRSENILNILPLSILFLLLSFMFVFAMKVLIREIIKMKRDSNYSGSDHHNHD